MVGQLKNKIDSLEELLRMSRHTVETLQQQKADLEASYLEKLAEFESMLKEQQRNANDSSSLNDPSSLNRQEMIKNLERMQEIAKTEAILEGQIWTPSFEGIRVSICI
jgi:hypothetical protein